MQTPREDFVAHRFNARRGEDLYDGPKIMFSFSKEINDRVEALAGYWKVPRADMVRWLATTMLEAAEQLTLEHENEEGGDE